MIVKPTQSGRNRRSRFLADVVPERHEHLTLSHHAMPQRHERA
jgi:hypothetical protein